MTRPPCPRSPSPADQGGRAYDRQLSACLREINGARPFVDTLDPTSPDGGITQMSTDFEIEDDELDKVEEILLGHGFSLAINRKAFDAIRYLRHKLDEAQARRIVYSPDAKAMSDRCEKLTVERDYFAGELERCQGLLVRALCQTRAALNAESAAAPKDGRELLNLAMGKLIGAFGAIEAVRIMREASHELEKSLRG